jgi:hypothetical protein
MFPKFPNCPFEIPMLYTYQREKKREEEQWQYEQI